MDAKLLRLAEEAGRALQGAGWMLVTAESCTGGWIAQAVTTVPGASAWFDRGFVVYSNAAKEELLGVRPSTLAAHGAVSEEAVREMAQGALERSRAQVAVAVSGIAGPTGGTREKPVGTVCIAWAVREGSTRVETHCFSGDREAVRRQAVEAALDGIARCARGGR
ncbi:CinA family protein [Pelomicrobium sp. G1]|uniref:CinA family protein n=1 Tax=unclassified Pelomicrobium TaxID=2815318 RepID=UPI003F7694C5